jgi:large subunit ribosomal protein L16
VSHANDAQAGEVPQKPARQDEGTRSRGNYVAFGEFGLQTTKAAWITARQIEAGRVAAMHFLRREGRVFIRIFPHKPVSGKPLETRMGKGKGEPEYWVAVVKPGTVMFEITGVDEPTAKRAWPASATRCPCRAGSSNAVTRWLTLATEASRIES